MSSSSFPTRPARDDSAITQRVYQATQRLSLSAQWRLLVVVLACNDLVMLLAAYGLAYWIRFNVALEIFSPDAVIDIWFYRLTTVLLIPLWIIGFYLYGLYDRRNLLDGTREYARVFHVGTLSMVVVVIIDFAVGDTSHARGWVLMSWVLSFLFVAGSRFVIRRIVYALRRQGYFTANAVIVGADEEGFALAQQLSTWQTSGLNVLGFIDDQYEVGDPVGDQFVSIGKVDDLDAVIKQFDIEELILASGALPHDDLLDVFKRFGMSSDVNIRLSSGLFGLVTNGLEVTHMAFVPLIRVKKMRFNEFEGVVKLFLDYTVSLTFLLFAWPALLLIALRIKHDSPGPVIHRRRVMGLNGRQFDAFKFRTMRVDGDEILDKYPELKAELLLNQKLKDDPRVTRIGRFLRQYSLDELPQLFNVLKRDMSLVGPRMISPEEMQFYGKWGMNLLTVKPGMTGLWQVSGRSDTTYDQRVQLDMYYIRNWTIWSDIYLLWLTIPAVIKKRGAY